MCTKYYLKVQFATQAQARKTSLKMRKFFKEGIEAYHFWQRNREMENEGYRKKFWSFFKSRFPQVYAYLGRLTQGDGDDRVDSVWDFGEVDLTKGNCGNGLSGVLDFGEAEFQIDKWLTVSGREIRYRGRVWHGTDWSRLTVYIKKTFGAVKVGWICELEVKEEERKGKDDNYFFDHAT